MTGIRKQAIWLLVIFAIIGFLVVIRSYRDNHDGFAKVFYEYKAKGKSSQFSPDDIKKSFRP